MKRTSILFIVAALLFSTTVSFAATRTWTDRQGNTIRAKFLRVHNSDVVLMKGTRPVKVPLANLSDADQQYLQQLQSGNVPSPQSSDPENETGVTKPKLEKKKRWTQRSGTEMNAEFVRVHDRNVILKQGSRVKSIVFDDFVDSDQEYIKELLRSSGELGVIEALEKPPVTESNNASPAGNQGSTNSGGSSYSRPSSLSSRFAQMRREQEQRRQEQLAENRRRDEERRREAAQRQREDTQRRAEIARKDAERQQRETERIQQQIAAANERGRKMQEDMQRSQQEMVASLQHSRQTIPSHSINSNHSQQVMEYFCTGCKKSLPDHIGLGDRCPHCRGLIEFEETETGQRKYSSSYSSGRSMGRALRGIVWLVIVVVFGAGAVLRKILS